MLRRDGTRGRTRSTRQRAVILEELQSVTCHPTADELYRLVRRSLPRISLGTIYRNLEVLTELGEIQRVDAAGGQMHFDGNPRPHSHIRCRACGAVADIDWTGALPALGQLAELTDWQVTGRTLELTGYCPQCHASQPAEAEDYREVSNAE